MSKIINITTDLFNGQLTVDNGQLKNRNQIINIMTAYEHIKKTVDVTKHELIKLNIDPDKLYGDLTLDELVRIAYVFRVRLIDLV